VVSAEDLDSELIRTAKLVAEADEYHLRMMKVDPLAVTVFTLIMSL